MKYVVMTLSKNGHLKRPNFGPNSCIGIYINIYQTTGENLKVIHTLGYEIISLKQLSASTCFKTIVRLMHSARIKQALGMNRYKGMGTS